ncbi:hypothetical protein [Agreia sp. VKM Ac-1783]|uniref:hypothetical protein n=1 Tax=Agreia sp. VKM Ac-1783 TaxID=1938889 RepID=UPI000A2AE94B|nr:hypothetical protein [Agreia sp. VKM Ac-1783]SMQ74927.1 hypothetical protein SAMN06295943_3326 [Agreia sp. VKM Ac-1783]
MKTKTSPLEVAALVVLAGLGLYFAVVVPALTMTLHALPVGLIFLAAAAALVIFMVRRSHRR